ncbi:MFS transporter [Streptomyces sp. NPDC006660]|uniref:MFS transporter n=1 Tax=Streptomyces sp. NPDC006660 TaxID=3156901 RepID=UPI0034007027
MTAAKHPLKDKGQGTTLVLVGTLTIMAGATVAPAIPGIREAFADSANVDLLARMITTTHALAIVLFSPLAGRVVERLGRKRALITGLFAFGIGGSSGAYLPDLYSLLVGRAVLGIGVSLIMTSSMAMIADLYEGADRQRLLGRQAAAGSFGGVVLLLGGGALAGLDWRVVFLIYLLGGLLLVPALMFLPGGRTIAAPREPGAPRPTGSRKVPGGIVAALAAMLLGQVAFYSVPVQVPFLVEDHFDAPSVVAGGVMAVQTFTTGMVAMRFAFFRRLAGEFTLAALSFLAIGIGYLILAVAPNIAVLVVALLVMGTGLGFLMPNLNNWVLAEAPAEVRARYAGLLTTALFLGQFLAPVITQPIVSALGIQPTFAVVACGALVVSVAYYLGGRAQHKEPAAGRDAGEVEELTERFLAGLRTPEPGSEPAWARSVFTEDVMFSYPDGTDRGMEGFEDFHRRARDGWGPLERLDADYAVDVDGDRATVTVTVRQQAAHEPGATDAATQVDIEGHYEARAVRTAEGWRFGWFQVRSVTVRPPHSGVSATH